MRERVRKNCGFDAGFDLSKDSNMWRETIDNYITKYLTEAVWKAGAFQKWQISDMSKIQKNHWSNDGSNHWYQ